MFGKVKKSMSGNDKFIMAKGRAVGNISPPASSANLKGNGSVKKTAPAKPNVTKVTAPVAPVLTTAKRKSIGKAMPVRIA